MWEKISKWKFWLSFQASLIMVLYIIGNIRSGNTIERIFVDRPLEAAFGFMGTIVGFPSGYLFLFFDKNFLSNKSVGFIYLSALIYYILFFVLVWYMSKKKEYYKFIAVVLFIFMILCFGGCSRVIDISLIIT